MVSPVQLRIDPCNCPLGLTVRWGMSATGMSSRKTCCQRNCTSPLYRMHCVLWMTRTHKLNALAVVTIMVNVMITGSSFLPSVACTEEADHGEFYSDANACTNAISYPWNSSPVSKNYWLYSSFAWSKRRDQSKTGYPHGLPKPYCAMNPSKTAASWSRFIHTFAQMKLGDGFWLLSCRC